MSRPTFQIIKLLNSVKDRDDFITKDEIESNPNNSKLNLKFQQIEIDKMETVYLIDERLNERERKELKRLNKYVIDKNDMSLEREIKKIEEEFEFQIIEKSFSSGNIESKGKSQFILKYIPNPDEKEKAANNLKIINYRYKTNIEGFYEETISYKYDLMIDDFYGKQIPNCIGTRNDFLQIEKYVKQEFREYFKNEFINKFKEGMTFFLWDY